MSVSQLKSGRWRAQVYEARTGKNVSVAPILGLPPGTTFASKRDAKAAREDARKLLYAKQSRGVLVEEFWTRWTTDPLFARPKESTNIHNRERTAKFVAAHAGREMASISDIDVERWLRGGHRTGTVDSLRAMWNDAMGPLGPRLVSSNPFARLKVSKKSRAEQQPPTVEQAERIVQAAREVSCPSFAGWLRCAMWSGMRPGELDALRWEDVDFGAAEIKVSRQWNAKTRTFTTPKNGRARPVLLLDESREAILAQPQVSEFVFVNLHGSHWTPPSRAYHWKATRARASWNHSLYLATRHFFGFVAYNELLLDAEDVAYALGHGDGGELVRRVYGHRSRDEGLERVRQAFQKRKAA